MKAGLQSLAFLLTIFTFLGCCRKKDVPINPDLQAWIPYSFNETIVMENDSGDVDTLDVNFFMESWVDESSYSCGEWQEEILIAGLESRRDPDVDMTAALRGENFSIGAAATVRGIWNAEDDAFLGEPAHVYYAQHTIAGTDYSDVMQFNCPDSCAIIDEIYWARNIGLVGFREFHGPFWTLK